jgi:hypothetical protein
MELKSKLMSAIATVILLKVENVNQFHTHPVTGSVEVVK